MGGITGACNGVAIALTALGLVAAGCSGDGPAVQQPEVDPAAVAVAEEYLDALADVDVAGLCETYSGASRQAEFEEYDVTDCAAYEVAFIRDDTSGYRATETMEQSFEVGEATGDADRVEVAFVATLTYLGDNAAAQQFYEENPTVPGAVVVVREGEEWGVDKEGTQESFHRPVG